MVRKTNTEILCEHLILCEGRDEQEFLIHYLNSESLKDCPAFSTKIQVIDFGGNSDLSNFLKVIQNSDKFDTVKSILIIRDSERDSTSAIQGVKSALKNSNLSIPTNPYVWTQDTPQIGYLLFPTCDNNPKEGTLENLCLSILSSKEAPQLLSKIDSFLSSLTTDYGLSFPRNFKNKLHTYFSVHDKYVSMKIGEASKAGAFNWDSELLKPLKQFIQEVL